MGYHRGYGIFLDNIKRVETIFFFIWGFRFSSFRHGRCMLRLPLSSYFPTFSNLSVVQFDPIQLSLNIRLEFSYTTYVIDTAGTTFNRLGVIPLNSPRTPSPFTVLTATSHIPS